MKPSMSSLVRSLALIALPWICAAREPERKELWVPSSALGEVLKEHPNAVLLDRAQYEALIRDAGKVKPGEREKPPVEAVIEGVKLNADLVGGASEIAIKAVVTVNSLVDSWTEVKLTDWPAEVRLTRFDRSDVFFKEETGGEGRPQRVLAVRGKGRHRIEIEFRSPLRRNNRICQAVVPYLARPFSITATPHGTARVSERWPQHDGVAIVPGTSATASSNSASLTWSEEGAVKDALVLENVDCLAEVRGDSLTSFVRAHLQATDGVLPPVIRFKLGSPDVQVIKVSDFNVTSWKQDGAMLLITRRGGFMTGGDFKFDLLKPLKEAGDRVAVSVEVPRYEGNARVVANAGMHVATDLEFVGWDTPGREVDDAFRAWEKTQRKAADITALRHFDVAPDVIKASVRRIADRFSADVDNRIVIATHEVMLDRTIALRGEEGRVNRTTLRIPDGEQFLGLSAASGERIDWKQLDPAGFEITWPGGLAKGKATTLWLRTRKDIGAMTAGGGGAEKLVFENVKLKEATRVAGYVALDFDSSWKTAESETTGLETRDARTTPVKGRMAWFTLRDYKLALDISRNDPVLDAAVVAYALPRAKTVEIEGQFMLQADRAPVRKFDVKLPLEVAKLLRVDSPLVGSQSLDEKTGTWSFSFRKELLGLANVRFHLALPASAGGDAKLSAVLPAFALPAARHFSGTWIIEANTDTEIGFDMKGVQPVDALHAPQVDGYAPRHRVIAAFGYGASAYEVKLTATRHQAGALIAAVVEDFSLLSVLSADGTSRHEAGLRVRHNGQQFFGMKLPHGASVISAKVQGETVKPVRAGADEVRVPLAGRAAAGEPLTLSVVYELNGTRWTGSGRHRLEPPTVGDDVPVLSTHWRVIAPDGMNYEARGGLAKDGAENSRTLVGMVGGWLAGRWIDSIPGGGSWAMASHGKKEAKAAAVTVVPMERYEPAQTPEHAKNFEDVKRHLQLAKSFESLGDYDHAGKELQEVLSIDKYNTTARQGMERVEQRQGALQNSARDQQRAKMLNDVNRGWEDRTPVKLEKEMVSSKKPGLISLDVAVPESGQKLAFSGHHKPGTIELRYESWERKMLHAAGWMVAGVLAFLMFGRRRSWLRTIAAALLFTCLPMIWFPLWTPVFNSLLVGWLMAFLARIVWGVSRWFDAALLPRMTRKGGVPA